MTPIEIAARAAWNLHHPPNKPWEEVPEIIRKAKMRQMEVAFQALDDAGFVLMPKDKIIREMSKDEFSELMAGVKFKEPSDG